MKGRLPSYQFIRVILTVTLSFQCSIALDCSSRHVGLFELRDGRLQQRPSRLASISRPHHHRSAHPYLQPGDIAIFADNPHPKVGKFIAARPLDGGDPIVKVVAVDAHRYLLRSANPAYNDLPIEQFQILGVLIGIYTADGELAIGPVPSGIGPDYLKDRLSNRLE